MPVHFRRWLMAAACMALATPATARDFRSAEIHPADYPTTKAVREAVAVFVEPHSMMLRRPANGVAAAPSPGAAEVATVVHRPPFSARPVAADEQVVKACDDHDRDDDGHPRTAPNLTRSPRGWARWASSATDSVRWRRLFLAQRSRAARRRVTKRRSASRSRIPRGDVEQVGQFRKAPSKRRDRERRRLPARRAEARAWSRPSSSGSAALRRGRAAHGPPAGRTAVTGRLAVGLTSLRGQVLCRLASADV